MRGAPLAFAVCVLGCVVLLGVAPAGAHQTQKPAFPAGVWHGEGSFTYTGPKASGRGVYKFFLKIDARGNVVTGKGNSELVVTAVAWPNKGASSDSAFGGRADIPLRGTAAAPVFSGAVKFPIVLSGPGGSRSLPFVMPMMGKLTAIRGTDCRKTGKVMRTGSAGGAKWGGDQWTAQLLSRSCPAPRP